MPSMRQIVLVDPVCEIGIAPGCVGSRPPPGTDRPATRKDRPGPSRAGRTSAPSSRRQPAGRRRAEWPHCRRHRSAPGGTRRASRQAIPTGRDCAASAGARRRCSPPSESHSAVSLLAVSPSSGVRDIDHGGRTRHEGAAAEVDEPEQVRGLVTRFKIHGSFLRYACRINRASSPEAADGGLLREQAGMAGYRPGHLPCC